MIEKIIQLLLLDLHFIIINYQLYLRTPLEMDARATIEVMASDYFLKAE